MRIRHVIAATGRMPSDPEREQVSGVVGAVLGQTRELANAGYDLQIWGWNDTRPVQHASWDNIKIWTSPEWSWARFSRWDVRWPAPIWCRGLTQKCADLLHAHVDPNLLYTPGARIRLLHLHTAVPDPIPHAYRRLFNRADAVICCSDFLRTMFLRASGYPNEQTFVVHNGADISAYKGVREVSYRAKWGVKEEDFIILYAGAIVPEKGVDHLVRAFAHVEKTVPNAVLLILGDAQLWSMPGGNVTAYAYEDKLRRLADGLNVRFVGSLPRTQMPLAFMAADVVAVPSLGNEAFGMVVCEAMAAGRPVVASRAGGIVETVRHGETGFLVAPGHEVELAKAINTLALDEALRKQMGQAASKRAEIFTWEASAQRLDSIYRELLMASEG